MSIREEDRLLELLNARHSWPCIYSFKFIVPESRGEELRSLIPEAEKIDSRNSSGGKYTAYTFHCPVGSGREVLEMYARVRDVPGIVSL